MRDQFDGVIVNEMRRFEFTLDQIFTLLNDKRVLSASEREKVTKLYATVKEELRTANKSGTVGGARRQQTESEARYFEPAVRQALIALRAATNTNPISSRWSSLASGASTEISYHLHRFEEYIGTCSGQKS